MPLILEDLKSHLIQVMNDLERVKEIRRMNGLSSGEGTLLNLVFSTLDKSLKNMNAMETDIAEYVKDLGNTSPEMLKAIIHYYTVEELVLHEKFKFYIDPNHIDLSAAMHVLLNLKATNSTNSDILVNEFLNISCDMITAEVRSKVPHLGSITVLSNRMNFFVDAKDSMRYPFIQVLTEYWDKMIDNDDYNNKSYLSLLSPIIYTIYNFFGLHDSVIFAMESAAVKAYRKKGHGAAKSILEIVKNECSDSAIDMRAFLLNAKLLENKAC